MYASVAVNRPLGLVGEFTYAIPAEMEVVRGDLVVVPFGNSTTQGVVWSLTDELPSDVPPERLKQIAQIVEPRGLLSAERLALADWLANYFKSSKYDACELMLPRGIGTLISAEVRRAPQFAEFVSDLDDNERKLFEKIPAEPNGTIKKSVLVRKAGLGGERKVQNLIKKGVAELTHTIDTSKIRPSTVQAVELVVSRAEAEQTARQNSTPRTSRTALKVPTPAKSIQARLDVIEHLSKNNARDTRAKLKESFSPAAVDWLFKHQLAQLKAVEKPLNLLKSARTQTEFSYTLSAQQKTAFEAIKNSLHIADQPKKPFLLFGETGSGKTEVYFQAIQECLNLGRGALMLVPEIGLTPSMLARISLRFPDKVALLHSGLTPAQLVNQWMAVARGDLRVVLGTRSALFAPIKDLGLVVMDEEHEWTYKETHHAPFYHARTVAKEMCDRFGATFVLGSATPDIGTFRHATQGTCHLLTLQGSPFQAQHGIQNQLRVELVDMRKEVAAGNFGILSPKLQDALGETLAQGETAIIFANRLGLASLLQCVECGTVRQCNHCDANMVVHDATRTQPPKFVCHYCGYSIRAYRQCKACGGGRIRGSIPGVQGVEREIKRLFKDAKIARWDSTTATNHKQHTAILQSVEQGKTNVLLGTQMLAKGLDIHQITLAAVVSADSIINIPDFRSDERLFQLITQLIGRAGRGVRPARAILQSFMPDHYAISTAAQQDYRAFYGHAIDIRARHRLPPFSRFIRLMYSTRKYEQVRDTTKQYVAELQAQIQQGRSSGVQIIGPSPAYPFRVRNMYRMQITLKGTNPAQLLEQIPLPAGDWKIDVDPINFA